MTLLFVIALALAAFFGGVFCGWVIGVYTFDRQMVALAERMRKTARDFRAQHDQAQAVLQRISKRHSIIPDDVTDEEAEAFLAALLDEPTQRREQ